MNKQELQGAFSTIRASDDLINEVLSVEKEKKVGFGWKRRLRLAVAAVAAMAILVGTLAFWPTGSNTQAPEIIAVPGVMKVYACDLETTPTAELKEHLFPEDDFLWRAVWKITGGSRFGMPIAFHIPEDYFADAEVTFAISSDCEGFCDDMILTNGEALYLENQVDALERHNIWKNYGEKDFYLDVIIYADGKIAGYAVMSFYMKEDIGCCYAFKCSTVCFPIVNGELQDVSEEYVLERIAQYRQAQPEGQGAEFFEKLHENEE